MIPPYDHQALWTKAKVFINRAMDREPARSFDEQALWASAALELLGKAALARVSPLLIAEPTEDGVNILIATGLIEGTAKFTSVSAATVFKRCQKAFRPFSAEEALKFATARNEYMHGSGIGFMTLPPNAWWPRYWALAAILIDAQDREIADLVGGDREKTVQDHLKQNAKNIEHRTESLIARAKQRLTQFRAGTLPAKIKKNGNPSKTCQVVSATARLRHAQRAEAKEPSKARTTATGNTNPASAGATTMTPTSGSGSPCPSNTSFVPPVA